MTDFETYKEIKLLQKQGHSFTYITMYLDLEDDLVTIALNTKNYAEFEEAFAQIT